MLGEEVICLQLRARILLILQGLWCLTQVEKSVLPRVLDELLIHDHKPNRRLQL